MRKAEKDEIALINIDRHPLMVFMVALLAASVIYVGAFLLTNFNPWGFIIMVPGAFLAFYLLWLFLNPFALIFENKFEIKHSFLNHKARYFVDIKNVSRAKGNKLYITYNDDEVERVNLFGIRSSQIALLQTEIEKMVSQSLSTRS
ncbi:MAG: hypothetical protein PSX36_07020 [bacterium]|nr:hypothetical protein [bacterium]